MLLRSTIRCALLTAAVGTVVSCSAITGPEGATEIAGEVESVEIVLHGGSSVRLRVRTRSDACPIEVRLTEDARIVGQSGVWPDGGFPPVGARVRVRVDSLSSGECPRSAIGTRLEPAGARLPVKQGG